MPRVFVFPPVFISVIPWFWTAEAIAPGWSSPEFSPQSMPAKVVLPCGTSGVVAVLLWVGSAAACDFPIATLQILALDQLQRQS